MKTYSKEVHTGRNNKAPKRIYNNQRTECEEHSLQLSTRCNNCIALS